MRNIKLAILAALLFSTACGNRCCDSGDTVKLNGKDYLCRYVPASKGYFELVSPNGEVHETN